MRAAAAVAVVLLGLGSAAHGGELDQLRKENAELRARVQELESENARLRGSSGGLAAALEQRATAAVAVAPGEAPGSTTITTEASQLEGIGGGKSRHWITWRAERAPGQAGRPDSAAIVIETASSGHTYRDVSTLRLVVDGTPVDCPVANYRTEMVTWGRDASRRGASEHVTATVPAAVLDKVANANDVSGTLGPTSFHLTPEQIAAARAFVQRLGA
jgi:hypothetical protein